MPTIRDVAAEAGVSTATVSRVLNTPEKVSRKTVNKVNEAAEKLGYSLVTNRSAQYGAGTQRILVVLPDFRNSFMSDVISGLNDTALKNDYTLMVAATNSMVEREREIMRILHNRQADGVIFLSSVLPAEEIQSIAERFPAVQCCEYADTAETIHVSVDNYAVGQQATEYLLQRGYGDIVMLSSANRFISTRLREKAFTDALKAAGESVREKPIYRASYSFESGFIGMQSFLQGERMPRAVFAISDNVAAGAIRAIQSRGLSVPGDIAVIGVDNIKLCTQLTPQITTVAQPREQIGSTAMQLLLNRIGGAHGQSSIYLPHELIVREST
ncbi:MAG: LacI family transcriptional regulator [Clostridia bacterium]|nr:LacI family transcriptional regulator [Clostridia bacterium]